MECVTLLELRYDLKLVALGVVADVGAVLLLPVLLVDLLVDLLFLFEDLRSLDRLGEFAIGQNILILLYLVEQILSLPLVLLNTFDERPHA